jgi:Tfp pilus assembly protein PilZ
VSSAQRTLRVEFERAEDFEREYRSNLSNGGVFVRTGEAFEPREPVEVELALPYLGRSLSLAGEVVDIVPAGMTRVGGTAGVAIQFALGVRELRGRLAPLVETARPDPADGGQRAAPRKPVHVPAQLRGTGCTVAGRTRNLSRTGVLVEVSGPAPGPGERVEVSLAHPTTGARCTLVGNVVRHIEASGELTAVAVHFADEEVAREETLRFIEEVQGIEHTRRLGAITGPIDALDPQAVLQMFANSSPRGTLVLRHGQEEAVLCFDQGLLLKAELSGKYGMQALVRMLSWRDGSFEFRASVEGCRVQGAPLPLEAAMFDAVRQIDEGSRGEQARFPLHARLVPQSGGDPDAYGGFSKVEAALMDLAHASCSVQRALEVIPEPDPQIFRALKHLADAGLLALES